MGGASTRVSNVVKGLFSKGCDITVVTAFPHYPYGNVPIRYRCKALVREKVAGVDVLRVWIPALPHNTIVNRVLLHVCFIVSSLFALPFVGKADVVWAANPNLFCFFSALAYGLVKRKPIVRNVDDLWPEVFYEMGIVRSKLTRTLLDFLAKISYVVPAAITPISAGYKCRIIEKYGANPEKIHVIEVGVDTVESQILVNNDRSQFIVMYSGILGVGYDFESVLKAARILSKHKDILFLIRGVGELGSKLRHRIRKLDLLNVVLDTNFLPDTELSALLRSADIFILPMSGESFVNYGLPTKVFEYQAYGKPIICISDGEPAKYVQATKSGLVVKLGDANGLGEAISKLYKDRKLAIELGRNGWKYVSENLTAERVGRRMCEVFLSTGSKGHYEQT